MWEAAINDYHAQGFVDDPCIGRRRDFLDGENVNEIVCHPVAASESAIMHASTLDIVEAIPFEKWGPGTGLVSYVHDAPYIECPESEAKTVAGILKECMTRTVKPRVGPYGRKHMGLPGVTFGAKPKIQHSWGGD